jgi:ABC-2 type transport system ATP-binding protein
MRTIEQPTALAQAPEPAFPATAQPRPALQAVSTSPALRVQDVAKLYGDTPALAAVSFAVPRGSVAAFVGPNGAGKTTTMRILLGLIKPSSGQAWVLGEPISEPASYLGRVGAMIESPTFYPSLSGRANLELLATLGGQPKRRVGEVLAQVELDQRADDRFRTYSLGMKQRLGIAAALLPDPELLILDEPTNGLDPAGIVEIRELLASLAGEGRTVFVSSHLLAEVEQIASWLVLLNAGKVLFSGRLTDATAQATASLALSAADNEHLLALVRDLGYDAALDGEHVVVAAPAEAAEEINQAAMARGIVLRELTPRRPTLEETFFELTGNGA